MSIYEYNQEEHLRMEREDAFEDGRKIGFEAGQEAGCTKMLVLIDKMVADGHAEQIPRLSKEPGFYEEMLKKYNM